MKEKEEVSRWWYVTNDNQHALSELFVKYHHELIRYGISVCRNEELANDCIQNLFLKLWKNKISLTEDVAIRRYLMASLRHHIVDHLREKNYGWERLPEGAPGDPLSCSSYESELIKEEATVHLKRRLLRGLEYLSPRQQQVVQLRFFEEKSYSEVATTMGMNVQSVRNLLHRAIKSLQRKLKQI